MDRKQFNWPEAAVVIFTLACVTAVILALVLR